MPKIGIIRVIYSHNFREKIPTIVVWDNKEKAALQAETEDHAVQQNQILESVNRRFKQKDIELTETAAGSQRSLYICW